MGRGPCGRPLLEELFAALCKPSGRQANPHHKRGKRTMERLTRIAFFSEHASPVARLGGADAGGQNVYVDEVSRNLARRGYAVDVFTRCDSLEVPEIIEWASGVRVVNLQAGPRQPRPKDELWPFMPEFRDAFLRFMVQDEAKYDLLHGNFWMSGWVVSELRKRLHIPAVQIFHAMGKTKRRHQKHIDTSPGDRLATEKDIIQAVDRVIAQCPTEGAELEDDYGADPHKVVIIPSAVNTRVFRPILQADARRRIGLDGEGKVIVYVGRLLPRKDIRNIVRAVAQLRQEHDAHGEKLTLLIVGGETVEPDPEATPELGELQRLAEELGIADIVKFMGKRQPNELRHYYSAGDVVVTTPWYEPFGLTPLEGMACGRPVIGSAVGGITYTIVDEVTGLLVPPRNPQELACSLYRLWQQPDLCQWMGKNAQQRVERQFVWSKVAEQLDELYNSMLAETMLAPLHTLTMYP